MKKIIKFLSLLMISSFLVISCTPPATPVYIIIPAAAPANDITVEQFTPLDVDTAVADANSIELSNGTWTYTCSATISTGSTPFICKSQLTLLVTDGGQTLHRTAMKLSLSRDIPLGVTEAEVEETIADLKTATYLEGIYIKNAEVTRVGNTIYLIKTYTASEIQMLERQVPAKNNKTQLFNEIFYSQVNSIVKTNKDKTKYYIYVNHVENGSTTLATVYIMKS